MAIITYDQLIAAISGGQTPSLVKSGGATLTSGVGYFNNLMVRSGYPGAMTTPTPGLNGEQVTSSTANVIPFSNAGTSAQKYLASVQLATTVVGTLFFYDRLWHNSGITVTTTTSQAFAAPVALPARDANGAAQGNGVEAWLEIYTATTNAAAINNATITYTNSAGTGSRTGTVGTIPANAYAGTMVPITMQAGDEGIQKVDAITLGTSLVTGSCGVVLLRRVAIMPAPLANATYLAGFEMVAAKLWANTALCMMFLNTSTTLPWIFVTPCLVEG